MTHGVIQNKRGERDANGLFIKKKKKSLKRTFFCSFLLNRSARPLSTRLTLSVLSISFWIYRILKKEELLCDILLNERRSWKMTFRNVPAAVSSIDVKREKKRGNDLGVDAIRFARPILLSKCFKKRELNIIIISFFLFFKTDQYAAKGLDSMFPSTKWRREWLL